MVQLRERDLTARDFLELTERCLDAAGRHSRIIVNDRMDVALAGQAHGVHLRSDSVDPRAARALAPSNFLIGRSVHGAEEARVVAGGGALDYLISGTIFPTASKPQTTASGVRMLAEVCEAVSVPVLAIGGVTVERLPSLAGSGAAGVAAIGLFLPPEGTPFELHIAAAVDAIRRAFDTCEAVP
jgi:thiamine-phosphate diphosphorylase